MQGDAVPSSPLPAGAPPAGAMPSGRSAIAHPIPLSNRLLAKPIIDPICLWGFKRLLPASRAWAAANLADGDPPRFAELLNLSRIPDRLKTRIKHTAVLRVAADHAFDVWHDAAFNSGSTIPAEKLAQIEVARRQSAQAHIGHRMAYMMFARRHRVPAVNYDIPKPDIALAQLREEPAAIERMFALPDRLPSIEVSRRTVIGSNASGGIAEYWLKFHSPVAPAVAHGGGDTAWVHVYEPMGADASTPSLIWGHGLAMELEMMVKGPLDFLSLVRAGIRVLMPDAPGHNRRTRLGFFGGEAFLHAAPISGLYHFIQAAREFATLVEWCRRQGDGKVALGGISLGALSTQVAACNMSSWPAICRPDALLLLTTTDQVSSLTTDSALGQVADVDRAVLAAGWQEEDIQALSPITDASPEPPIDPARIVLLLGRRDNVTPYAGGVRLARNWHLPAGNIFNRDQGHFSAAFGLAVDPAPYQRIIQILKG
ncbi:alpha/beta hydrolase family protein [Dongia soli]|uniref:Alpha/beta hydrolase family protein n=1 Tax=Dongia soli TaxID=600628 RepID=A0ABU5EBC9_9PROT|nr:alpha/beta hydrolase family protein [Dongia soli]MDY0883677.1 alpha/beta hydrolase family protein [Dongia soli]